MPLDMNGLNRGRIPLRWSVKAVLAKQLLKSWRPHEIQSLLCQLDHPFRLMVLLDATTGLRRSELFALKWGDIDFSERMMNVTRSIYNQVSGSCKTEASRKPVPLASDVVAELLSWKAESLYSLPDDWVFASPRSKGKLPYWPAILMRKVIRPAALRAGITKWIGWHTFRHSFSTLLIANGENVKVVQELMRHGSARITVDIYSQARNPAKREAQQRILQMIFPEERSELLTPSLMGGAPQRLDHISDLSPGELQAMWDALDQEESFM
jgi:integrase